MVARSRRVGLVAAHGGPVPLRRVTTLGATVLTVSTGLRNASEITATRTGVIAVAKIVPRCQNIGTIVAAAAAAQAEINSVWRDRPPLFSFCSGITIHASENAEVPTEEGS